VHWSKDFVEHLRTVHFALLTVSVGLILILTSAHYNAKVAASQLREVIRIMDDFQKRVDTLIADNADASEFMPRGEPYSVAKDGVWFTADPKKKLIFHVDDPPVFYCETGSKVRHFGKDWRPETLAQFAGWWNRFPIVVRTVNQLTEGKFHRPRTQPIPDSEAVSPIAIIGSTGSRSNPIYLTVEDLCADESLRLLGSVGVDYYTFQVDSGTTLPINQTDLHGNATTQANDSVTPFVKSFPDLATAASGNENEYLQDIGTDLQSEAAKGGDAFEAFGIKIPAERVTRWGMVVLVGVQLYFFMYLKRLSMSLKCGDAGWDVPWIAMDQSVLARIVLFVSIVLVPACAAFSILIQTMSPMLPDGWSWHFVRMLRTSSVHDNRVLLILMCCGLATSIFLSLCSWRYRPTLSEPAASPTIFE
jgi:hypothetical protein